DEQNKTMDPIFETIIQHIPAPLDTSDEPLQLQVTLLDYNDYVGRIGVGRVSRGTIKVGQQVTVIKKDGSEQTFRVRKLIGIMVLKSKEIENGESGDIFVLSVIEVLHSCEIICSLDLYVLLSIITVDASTLKMTFPANYSSFFGKEGESRTLRQIK